MAIRFIPENVFGEMLRYRREWSMGYHIVENDDGNTVSIAIAGIILIDLDEDLQTNASELASKRWLGATDFMSDGLTIPFEDHVSAFNEWCNSLRTADYGDVRPAFADILSRFVLDPFDPVTTPRGPKPATTARGRPAVHGHLPFTGTAAEETVFYRAEPFPTSRSIDPKNGKVTVGDGLYGFPHSELQFVPTGFAAVGRYALPNVAPSTYRWELRVPNGVPFSAGASVPLFGQAGGGVEICVEKDFQNVGHVANPIILPSL